MYKSIYIFFALRHLNGIDYVGKYDILSVFIKCFWSLLDFLMIGFSTFVTHIPYCIKLLNTLNHGLSHLTKHNFHHGFNDTINLIVFV